jgi:thiamine biosynthesis protein ThiS
MSQGQHAVLVNGESTSLPPDATLAELLARLDLGDHKVAVAINRNVVPRSRYAATTLDPGDHVEILEAVGGG